MYKWIPNVKIVRKVNKMINGFTYTEAKELIQSIGRFEIADYQYYGLTVIIGELKDSEYDIGTEEEADKAWTEWLESYWDECVIPEVPNWIKNYLDYDKWESDARTDERGHSLSCYDGCETDINGLSMFRIN